MIFGNRRVNDDLEKISRANMAPKEREKLERDEAKLKEKVEKLELEKGDVVAMILAIFSVIMPYVLIFLAFVGGFWFLSYLYMR